MRSIWPNEGATARRIGARWKEQYKIRIAELKSGGPEQYKRYRKNVVLKRKYGITVEEYDRMALSQSGNCAICNQARVLFVDHDHESGEIRALLCNTCNTLVGYIENHPEKILAAISYANKFGKFDVANLEMPSMRA